MIRSFRSVQPTWAGLRRWELFLVLVLALGATRAHCQNLPHGVYSLEHTRPQASSQLSAELVSHLQPGGFRVFSTTDEGKNLVCEVFWAKTIHLDDVPSPTSGILYENLKQGGLIGVIHFLVVEQYVRDFRSQLLRSGYYTMRYAILPKGSDDKEPRDFVLLTPVSADRNPAIILPLRELVHRSRLASAIKHPVALSLVVIDPDEKLPSLVSDEEGTAILQVKLHAAPARGKPVQDVPVALVVITSIPEDLGD
jgi:hypothetical protein